MSWFGQSKTSLRDQQIRLLDNWKDAKATKSDKSQYSVSFRCANGTFIFYILLPQNFPEAAPQLRFQTPVVHKNVAPDGVTIQHPEVQGWTAHKNIQRVAQACVNEFVARPPRTGAPAYARAGSGPVNVTLTFHSKPFGLKLQPKVKDPNGGKQDGTGAVIHSMDIPRDKLQIGMWITSIGATNVENWQFKLIIEQLRQCRVPINMAFQRPGPPPPVAQPAPAPWRAPAPVAYGAPVQPAAYAQAVPVRPPVPAPARPPEPHIPRPAEVQSPELDKAALDRITNVLDMKNVAQLEDLLANKPMLEQLALDFTEPTLKVKRTSARDNTKRLADNNLATKENVEGLRAKAASLRAEVEELQRENEDLCARMAKMGKRVEQSFEDKGEELDSASMKIRDEFDEEDEHTNKSCGEYVKAYRASREAYHQLQIKKHLLEQRKRK